MFWLDFVALVAATGAIVNAWLHPGGLFDDTRDWISVWAHPKVAQLFNCRLCLSYHAAFWLLVLFFIPSLWLSPPWDVVWFLPVYALAATRFSLLIGTAATALDIENDPEVD